MTGQPSPHALLVEMEQTLARSQDPAIKRMNQITEVFEFLDTQRMKMEQGRWSPIGYRMDRLKLATSKSWRQSPESARAQVSASLINLGLRIQMANEMKNLIEQVVEVGELMVAKLPQNIRDFASKISQRRHTQSAGGTTHPRLRP